jgi:hypothetical protein
MDNQIAFVTARVDEDEAAALACIGINARARIRNGVPAPRWVPVDGSSDIWSEDGILRVKHTWVPEREHICRHDPARVLREVEAKRAIVKRYEQAISGDLPEWKAGRELIEAAAAILLGAIRDLGAVWSDHPDYAQLSLPSTI